MLHMLLLPAKNNQKPTKNQRRNSFTPFNFGPWLVLNPMKTKENQRRIFSYAVQSGPFLVLLL